MSDSLSDVERAQRLEAAREDALAAIENARARVVQLRRELRDAELILGSRVATGFTEGGLGVTELGRRSGLPVAKVSRLLVEAGIRRYTLGEAMARALVPQWANPAVAGTATVEEIAERIDESGDYVTADHKPVEHRKIRQTAKRNADRFKLSADSKTVRLIGPPPERA